jgi:hypothetical protein
VHVIVEHSTSTHQQIQELIRYHLPVEHMREIDARVAHWLSIEEVRKTVFEVERQVVKALQNTDTSHLLPEGVEPIDFRQVKRKEITRPMTSDQKWCLCNLRKWRLAGEPNQEVTITLRDPVQRKIHHVKITGELVTVDMTSAPVLWMRHGLVDGCDHVMSDQFVPVTTDFSLICGVEASQLHPSTQRRFFWPVHRVNSHWMDKRAQTWFIQHANLSDIIRQVESKMLRCMHGTGVTCLLEGASMSSDVMMEQRHRVRGVDLEMALLWTLKARTLMDGQDSDTKKQIIESHKARVASLIDSNAVEALVTCQATRDRDKCKCYRNPWVWDYVDSVQDEYGPWLELYCDYTDQTGRIHLPSLQWYVDRPARSATEEAAYIKQKIHTDNKQLHGPLCSHGMLNQVRKSLEYHMYYEY